MKLENASKEQFRNIVEEGNYKIVLFGFGVIGRITAPYFLHENCIWEKFLFYVDSNENKRGEVILPNGECAQVLSPEKMREIDENFVIVITGSRYDNILNYLKQQTYLDRVRIFILPQMLLTDNIEKKEVTKKFEKLLIPPIIHYCWFGKGKIPQNMRDCIETWKKFCPDYEIVEWNESNYDVTKYIYTHQAYERKKWAFVTDVARLDILYNYGGIYIDTDVELIKNLDEFRYQEGFCGVEKWRILNTGGSCGAIKGQKMIGEMLEFRKKSQFVYEDGSFNMESSGSYETIPCIMRGFIPNNEIQTVNGLTIYSSDFFHPYDYMTKKCVLTDNTAGIHHFSGSWVD